jgi:hypothetical protein
MLYILQCENACPVDIGDKSKTAHRSLAEEPRVGPFPLEHFENKR